MRSTGRTWDEGTPSELLERVGSFVCRIGLHYCGIPTTFKLMLLVGVLLRSDIIVSANKPNGFFSRGRRGLDSVESKERKSLSPPRCCAEWFAKKVAV